MQAKHESPALSHPRQLASGARQLASGFWQLASGFWQLPLAPPRPPAPWRLAVGSAATTPGAGCMAAVRATAMAAVLVAVLVVPSAASAQTPAEVLGATANTPDLPHYEASSAPATAEARANLLLTSALRQSVWGPAVACRVRQSISILDRRLFGVGQYAHGGGNGWGKLKLSIRMPAGDQVNALQQISDGRVLYTTRHVGTEVERSRVNIERVREYLGTITQPDLDDPLVALHLATGGQPELLRTLCQQYHWYSVSAGKLGEIDVWWLRGRRTDEPPALRGQAEIDLQLAASDPAGLIPLHAQIALGRSQPLPLWLYRVEQSREAIWAGGGPNGPLVSTIEFFQPQIVTQMPEEMFEDWEAKTSVDPIVDETRKYLPPPRATSSLQRPPDFATPTP
jgi:hypothetical protein